MGELLNALTHWQFAAQVGAWMALSMLCNYVGHCILEAPPYDRFDNG